MPADESMFDGHDAEKTAQRVLVLVSVEEDAPAISHVLSEVGFLPCVCRNLAEVAEQLVRNHYGGAGAVIMAQESFIGSSPDEHRCLAETLAHQPAWSDLPLILLASQSSGENAAWEIARGLDPVGNITILERPLRRTTLLNAVAVALRTRARQYKLRATLQELSQHREHLAELVEQRTSQLADSMNSLRSSERLASLGTLAAGLGHDIANLTLPIRARLEALRAESPSDASREDIDAIGVAIHHLGQLSAGMRLLGMDPDRAGASAPANDLNEWAAQTTPMLQAALPRHVRLECTFTPGLGVDIPRHRLAQAIFNLVQNSGEAMASQPSGLVRVSAEPAAPDSNQPRRVRFRITDNGPGMTPEVLARCFEPYFSTKGRAIATGMGLAMVKGIIEASHGTIEVRSATGQGTEFTITLPAAGTRATPVSGAPTQTGAVTMSNPRVANLTCALLEWLRFKHFRHHEPGVPAATLWVLEDTDLSRAAEFLRHDVSRRAVVLTRANGSNLSSLHPQVSARLTVLPDPPTPAALRSALVSARSAEAIPA